MKIYGYVRISTMQQNIERQIRNIKEKYPEAIIIQDEYTGTKMDRPQWSKLYKSLKAGDVVVFDEVSRMSRDAEEGFKVYQELYDRGCELIFLKESHINTEAYREALKGVITADVKSGDQNTDELIAGIMASLNKFMMNKVKEDIRRAFDQAEKEVQYMRQRTREGIETARLNGKQVGRSEGDKLNIKKSDPIKALIRQYSKDFDGTLNDMELLGVLNTKTVKIPSKGKEKEISAHLSRNTLYKYKKELKEEGKPLTGVRFTVSPIIVQSEGEMKPVKLVSEQDYEDPIARYNKKELKEE